VTGYRSKTCVDKEAPAPPPLILIVDDDPMIRLLAEESLRQAGFRTHAVGTCKACLDALEHFHPEVILLDAVLPDGDSLSLCAELKRREDIPVALMATLQDLDESMQASDAIADDVVTKPIQWALLGRRMRTLCHLGQQRQLLRTLSQQQDVLANLIGLSAQNVSLEGFLQKALEQILSLPWPGQTGCGGLFMAEDHSRGLRLVAKAGLGRRLNRCDQVSFSDCYCGDAAREKRVLFLPGREKSGVITCEVGAGFDHYHIPLTSAGRLIGVLVLFVQSGHSWGGKQKAFLETVGEVLGRLIDHKRYERQLSLAASAFEGSLEAVLILDAELRVLEANKVFTDVTGYGADEIRGDHISVLHPAFEEKSTTEKVDPTLCSIIKRQLETQGHWQGEVWMRRKDDSAFLSWLQVGRSEGGGDGAFVMIFADITDRKRKVEAIQHLAFYDQLTGLCNRSLLLDRLTLACRHAKREGSSVGVLFFDLDRFKPINDTLGHDTGDLLLSEVAKRIRKFVREEDTAARLGGDEFVLLLSGLDGREERARRQVGRIAEKIGALLKRPFELGGHRVSTSASIGIAMGPADSQDPEELLKLADLAMYAAKRLGGDRYCFFKREMGQGRIRRRNLEGKMRTALDREMLELHLQPRLRVKDQTLVGVEVLLRWWDEEKGSWIPPDEFLPVAEQTGLIDDLDQWIWKRLGRLYRQWHSEGLGQVLRRVAVNVSSRQFQRPGYADRAIESILQSGLADLCRLELEVNEASLMRSPEDSLQSVSKLKEIGVRFAVDNFGTGLSNLIYLRKMQLDVLKIDQTLVQTCIREPAAASVIRAIVKMAQELDFELVAEGVETPAQLQMMSRLGCHYYQGYLCAPALSPEEFKDLLRNRVREDSSAFPGRADNSF